MTDKKTQEEKDTDKFDLDLDSLAPEAKTIKFGGKGITVNPPSTMKLIKLIMVSKKAKEAMDADNAELFAERTEEAGNVAVDMIPELKDAKLEFLQINSIVELMLEMAMPGQLKMLKEKGITLDTAKKVQAGS